MSEDYEAVYTHPGGATAIFTRRNGSLDAVARGLDSEQFWVFKNVKALLVRNDEGDLAEATRMMESLGFVAQLRRLAPLAAPAPVVVAEPVYAVEPAAHGHLHGPAPSYWPLLTAIGLLIVAVGLLLIQSFLFIVVIGLVFAFVCMVGWGLEPFEA